MTFFDAAGAAVDIAAACASAGLLATAGTIVVRGRRSTEPVRLAGRVVPHPRLMAAWMAVTGLWGLLAAGRVAGLGWIGMLPIVALMLVSLALLAALLSRTQQHDPAGARPGEPARTQVGESFWGRPEETTRAMALAGRAMRAGGRLGRRVAGHLRNGR